MNKNKRSEKLNSEAKFAFFNSKMSALKELHEEHDGTEPVAQRMGNHAWSQALSPESQKRKQESKNAHGNESKQSLKIVALDE